MESKPSPLKRTWSLLLRHPANVLIAAAWPYVAVVVALAIIRNMATHYSPNPVDPVAVWHQMGKWAKVFVIIAYLFVVSGAQGAALAGVCIVTRADALVEDTGLRRVLSEIFRNALPLIGLCLLTGCISALLGGILSIVGQVIVQTIFLPAAIILLMLQKPRPSVWGALRKSVRYTTDSMGTILLYGTFLAICASALAAGVYAIIAVLGPPEVFSLWLSWLLLLVVGTAVSLVMGVIATVRYCDREVGHLSATAVTPGTTA